MSEYPKTWTKDPNLIVAMDWLNKKTIPTKIKKIQEAWLNGDSTEQYKKYMKKLVWKVNDLIAWIWFEWLEDIFKEVQWWIMIDGKWHDIWNTNANYFEQLANYPDLASKTRYVTMHASNLKEWLKKAIEKRDEISCLKHVKILAVTTLTTFDDSQTNIIFDETSKHSVLKLAKEVLKAWVDGIVCSPMEAQLLRDVYRGYDFEIITPWVRFQNKQIQWDDQKRVTTPEEAIRQWSDHIVMWRPILWSEDVEKAINRFFEEIKNVWYSTNEQRHEFERLLYTGSWEELLKYIWAIYKRIDWWKYCRLASWLLSDEYINIWETERNYLVVERAANEMATKIKNKELKADIIMWAQMWSVRLSLYLAEKSWIEESIYTEKSWEDNEKMELKRHDIDLTDKKIILNDDILTKWTTIKRMIKFIEEKWWKVIAITCLWNRYWEDNFEWIPLISCYNQQKSEEFYYDEKTPELAKKDYPQLPQGSEISEKPKNDWRELIKSTKKLNN